MTRDELVTFLRGHRYAVEATASTEGKPQAAVVGIAVSNRGEIVFDTLNSTRKWTNLERNARMAFVVGFADEGSAQYEGVAEPLPQSEYERMTALYYAVFPDGRERAASWPGLTYVYVRPTWIRHLDYTRTPNEIEWDRRGLSELGFAVGES